MVARTGDLGYGGRRMMAIHFLFQLFVERGTGMDGQKITYYRVGDIFYRLEHPVPLDYTGRYPSRKVPQELVNSKSPYLWLTLAGTLPGSDDEEYAMAVRDFKKFFIRRGKFVRQPHDDKKAFRKVKEEKKGKEERSEEDDDSKKEEICLMAHDLNEVRLKVKLEPNEWIKDSGYSRHMTGNKDLFSTYEAINRDHGRKFDNEVEFGAFCDANGITHNFSAPRTPQSNEVVERKNRTLQEMSRTMLNEQSIPQNVGFW
ncbi:retrovirus-related pol polyprotein from transposon TNT 1-94 [Tanacetum coccineum]